MESYKQTSDVFAFVGEFHKKIELFYRDLEEKSDDKRVQMLLEFLRQHEKRYADALVPRQEKTGDALYETWIQYVPLQEYFNLDDLEVTAEMSIDDIVDIALELNNRLLRFFTILATGSVLPPDVRNAFRSMTDQEESGRKEIVQTAEDLKEL